MIRSGTRSTAVLFGLFGLCSIGQAGTVLIDDFSMDQFFGVGPGGTNNLSTNQGVSTGATSIGGARNTTITRVGGNSFDFVSVMTGLFQLSLAAGDTGTTLILWDGGIDNVNSYGLGGIDLSGGLTNGLIHIAARSDAVAPMTITVYSSPTNYSVTTVQLPGLGFNGTPFSEYFIPFLSFITGGGVGANFSSVAAITVLIDGSSAASLDAQLDYIQAEAQTPEPATLALVGTILVALGGRIRRRRA